MKFAFSTESCPEWDFPTTAGKAREYGYDGVELRGAASGAMRRLTLDNPAVHLEILGAFPSAGIEIACIAAPVRLTGDRNADVHGAEVLRRWIDLSTEFACPRVMLRDPEARRGVSGGAAGMALGEWLSPIADHALDCGVTLVVCNDATLTSARLMWTMLERLHHPAITCCWDLHNGVRAGESPAVSVPTLNSQIRYARVGGEAKATADPKAREPGTFSDVQFFLTRLRGVGYGGYVTAAAPPGTAGAALSLSKGTALSLPAVSLSNPSNPSRGPDEYLRDMVAGLRKWATPVAAVARRKQETRPKAG